MPHLDGLSVVRNLRGCCPGTRLVLMSAALDAAEEAAARAAGADAIVPKDAVSSLVDALLDGHR
jgi:CheY-like chemotaxis protein